MCKVYGDPCGVGGCGCVAYWKEERGPQHLPSFSFFVSSSVGGAWNRNGCALNLVVVRIILLVVPIPVWWSCCLMFLIVSGLAGL